FAYPNNPSHEKMEDTRSFFMSLQGLLPCEKCRYNLAYHYSYRPLTDGILKNKYYLINWLIDIHNDVNISLGKPVMTYTQVINEYFGNNEPFFTSGRMILIFIIILTLLCVIILLKFS